VLQVDQGSPERFFVTAVCERERGLVRRAELRPLRRCPVRVAGERGRIRLADTGGNGLFESGASSPEGERPERMRDLMPQRKLERRLRGLNSVLEAPFEPCGLSSIRVG
jgi:hypothetical protein